VNKEGKAKKIPPGLLKTVRSLSSKCSIIDTQGYIFIQTKSNERRKKIRKYPDLRN
jgi:hypothetical protein